MVFISDITTLFFQLFNVLTVLVFEVLLFFFLLDPELLPFDLNILEFLDVLLCLGGYHFLALGCNGYESFVFLGEGLDHRLKLQFLPDDLSDVLVFVLG